jgi:hypothetical protein
MAVTVMDFIIDHTGMVVIGVIHITTTTLRIGV